MNKMDCDTAGDEQEWSQTYNNANVMDCGTAGW